MKAVILAGGYGTRLSEETDTRPKPMVEIGGNPILWHIMKIYSSYGINDFIVCLGYKGYVIKEYFLNYYLHQSDITFDLAKNKTTIHNSHSEPWKITLVDTGEKTLTGGRLKRTADYIGNETFCLTYGDGVSDVNIKKLIQFHQDHLADGNIATVTAVMPRGKYGAIELEGRHVRSFIEKPQREGTFINGGFFVFEPAVLDYIEGDDTSLELDPLHKLSIEGRLQAFKHFDFWQSMDTLWDKRTLEEFWASGKAPWKTW